MNGPDPSAAAAAIGGFALLERAVTYTLGSLALVTADTLDRPTPCRAWPLRRLLDHLTDSMGALREAVDAGRVALTPSPGSPPAPAGNPVAALRILAADLVGAWANANANTAAGRRRILLGEYSLTSGVVTSAGAIEVAVHGWDVARACGADRPLPASLADELLDLCPLLVRGAERPGRFARPVAVPPTAGPGDRLVAFLGRDPAAIHPAVAETAHRPDR
jgi:uncharacterized protein (TIGR03086 family)